MVIREVLESKVPSPDDEVHNQAVATALEMPVKETSPLLPQTVCPIPASTVGEGEMVSVKKSETAVHFPCEVDDNVKITVPNPISPVPGV